MICIVSDTGAGGGMVYSGIWIIQNTADTSTFFTFISAAKQQVGTTGCFPQLDKSWSQGGEFKFMLIEYLFVLDPVSFIFYWFYEKCVRCTYISVTTTLFCCFAQVGNSCSLGQDLVYA